MAELRIILEGDGAFPELGKTIKEDKLIEGVLDAITALPGGMASGLPSVAFVINLPDGRVMFAETSMRMFQMAAAAFKGRYGDVT